LRGLCQRLGKPSKLVGRFALDAQGQHDRAELQLRHAAGEQLGKQRARAVTIEVPRAFAAAANVFDDLCIVHAGDYAAAGRGRQGFVSSQSNSGCACAR